MNFQSNNIPCNVITILKRDATQLIKSSVLKLDAKFENILINKNGKKSSVKPNEN